MKHVMEFTLPEEAEELRLAQGGPIYWSALRAVDEALRSRLKYDMLSAATRKHLEELRRLLHEECRAAPLDD